MKNIAFLFLALLLISTGCDKDDAKPAAGCLEEPTDFTGDGCDSGVIPSAVCTVENIGDYSLDQVSRSYQPYFCEDVNSHTYVAENGKELIFTISQRNFLRSVATYASVAPCPTDATKRNGYCITFEDISYQIFNEQEDIEFTISVFTKPDLENQTGNNAGDYLQISRKIDEQTLQVEFSSIIQQKTLSISEEPFQEFYDVIELNGISFDNVISNDVSGQPTTTFKYYYTRASGLIGFVDDLQTLWVLRP